MSNPLIPFHETAQWANDRLRGEASHCERCRQNGVFGSEISVVVNTYAIDLKRSAVSLQIICIDTDACLVRQNEAKGQ